MFENQVLWFLGHYDLSSCFLHVLKCFMNQGLFVVRWMEEES